MRMIFFMGALCQRVMSEQELYHWPFLPREMLGKLKKTDTNVSQVSEG